MPGRCVFKRILNLTPFAFAIETARPAVNLNMHDRHLAIRAKARKSYAATIAPPRKIVTWAVEFEGLSARIGGRIVLLQLRVEPHA